MEWEIDYREFKILKDDNGQLVQTFLLLVVEPTSFFVIKHHLAKANDKYLDAFVEEIKEAIKHETGLLKRIVVKKQDLFNLLSKVFIDDELELEIVQEKSSIDQVFDDFQNHFSKGA